MGFELQEYDWTKTVSKGIQIGLLGALGALIAHYGGLPQTETIIIVVAVLKMAQNYLKHA